MTVAGTTAALVAAGVTHRGLRRPGNEDSGYVGMRLLVVADGMGGVEYGEVASAWRTGSRWMSRTSDRSILMKSGRSLRMCRRLA